MGPEPIISTDLIEESFGILQGYRKNKLRKSKGNEWLLSKQKRSCKCNPFTGLYFILTAGQNCSWLYRDYFFFQKGFQNSPGYHPPFFWLFVSLQFFLQDSFLKIYSSHKLQDRLSAGLIHFYA